MADVKTRGDSMRFYLSGAAVSRGVQLDPALSLGGYRAGAEYFPRVLFRKQPIYGIVVEACSGYTSAGRSIIETVDGDLRYTPFGGAAGSAVAIAEGETKLVEGSTANHWLRIKRLATGLTLVGCETFAPLPLFAGPVGMADVEAAEATAGSIRYRAVWCVNESADAMTGVTVTGLISQPVRVAFETPSSGNVQAIANDTTAPTGLTWTNPYSAPLSVGSVAAGGEFVLWIERTVSAGKTASADESIELDIAFTVGGTTYTNRIGSRYRVANSGLPRWETFQSIDGAAYNFASPVATSQTKPYNLPALTVGHTHKLITRYKNAWGLSSQQVSGDRTEQTYVISAGGAQTANPPDAPTNVTAQAISGGGIRVQGTYQPAAGVIDFPDRVAVWVSSTGSAPSTSGTADAVVSIGTLSGFATWTVDVAGPYMDAAALKVIAKMRRTLSDGVTTVDSANSATVDVTAKLDGPVRPKGIPFHGFVVGRHVVPSAATSASDKQWVDQAKNIYLLPTDGDVQFWADTVLVWRAIVNSGDTSRNGIYLPTPWYITGGGSVTGAATTSPVDVGTWGGGSNLMYVAPYQPASANYQRRMLIDVTNKRITYIRRDAVNTVPQSTRGVAAISRWDGVNFQCYDPGSLSWVTYMQVASDGLWRMNLRLVQTLTQAQVLAL